MWTNFHQTGSELTIVRREATGNYKTILNIFLNTFQLLEEWTKWVEKLLSKQTNGKLTVRARGNANTW